MRALWTLVPALALLALAVSVQAGEDPETGDYAYIDLPVGGTIVPGAEVTFEGRAGNKNPTPYLGGEDRPMATDGKGDATYAHQWVPNGTLPGELVGLIPKNTTGTDIGHVWVHYDDGDHFEVSLRLHENPMPSTESGSTLYMANFTHDATDVTYRVNARLLQGSGWEFKLEALAEPDLNWCEAQRDPNAPFNWDSAGSGYSAFTAGAGGVINWEIPYETLNLTAPPATGCAYTIYGGASIGETLSDWSARSGHRASAGSQAATVREYSGDETSDSPGTHILGPAQAAPAPPYSPIDLTVNGVALKEVTDPELDFLTTDPTTDEWEVDLDLTVVPAINCGYIISIEFGTAKDSRLYPLKGCELADGPFKVIDTRIGGRASDAASIGSTAGGATARSASNDADLDGYTNDRDGCTYKHSPDRADLDQDGISDLCDRDVDGDAVPNGQDNCARTPNPDQGDADRNGVGDACETDRDGDGWSDLLDNCADEPNGLQVDRDNDGRGDVCDPDMDGDGVPNDMDAFPFDASEWSDLDGDGIGDNKDPDIDGDGFSNEMEMASGADPYNPVSGISEDSPYAGKDLRPSVAGSISGLGSIGILVALVVFGLLLFYLVRPKD